MEYSDKVRDFVIKDLLSIDPNVKKEDITNDQISWYIYENIDKRQGLSNLVKQSTDNEYLKHLYRTDPAISSNHKDEEAFLKSHASSGLLGDWVLNEDGQKEFVETESYKEWKDLHDIEANGAIMSNTALLNRHLEEKYRDDVLSGEDVPDFEEWSANYHKENFGKDQEYADLYILSEKEQIPPTQTQQPEPTQPEPTQQQDNIADPVAPSSKPLAEQSPQEWIEVYREAIADKDLNAMGNIEALVAERVSHFTKNGVDGMDIEQLEGFKELLGVVKPYEQKKPTPQKSDKPVSEMDATELSAHLQTGEVKDASGEFISKKEIYNKIKAAIENGEISHDNIGTYTDLMDRAYDGDNTVDLSRKLSAIKEELSKNPPKPVNEQAADRGTLAAQIDAGIEKYDRMHGLDQEVIDAEKVLDNLNKMESFGKDAFKLKDFEPKPIPAPTAETMAKDPKDMDLKELASFVAAGNTVSSSIIADKVQEGMKKGALDADNLSEFKVLVDNLSLADRKDGKDSLHSKAEALYNKTAEASKQGANPYFDNAREALGNIEFTDGDNAFSRRAAKEDTQEDMQAQFIEAVRLQTMNQLATQDGDIKEEDFNKLFEANLAAETMALAQAQDSLSGDTKATDGLAKGKKVQITMDAYTGYMSQKSRERDVFANRVVKKTNRNTNANHLVAKNLAGKNQALDAGVDKTTNNRMSKAKRFLKPLCWTAAYMSCGLIQPPQLASVALAGVATAHTVMQIRGLALSYREQKAQDPSMNGAKFLKKNWKAVAGAALTATSAVAYGCAAMDPTGVSSLAINNAKRIGTVALGIGKAFSSYAENRRKGKSVFNSLFRAASGAALTTTAAAYATDAFGAQDTINDVISNVAENEHVQSVVETVREATGNATEAARGAVGDRDGDGVPDMIDRDGGEGWANNEAELTPEELAKIAKENGQMAGMAPNVVANQVFGVENPDMTTAEINKLIEKATPEQQEALARLRDNFDQKTGHFTGELGELEDKYNAGARGSSSTVESTSSDNTNTSEGEPNNPGYGEQEETLNLEKALEEDGLTGNKAVDKEILKLRELEQEKLGLEARKDALEKIINDGDLSLEEKEAALAKLHDSRDFGEAGDKAGEMDKTQSKVEEAEKELKKVNRKLGRIDGDILDQKEELLDTAQKEVEGNEKDAERQERKEARDKRKADRDAAEAAGHVEDDKFKKANKDYDKADNHETNAGEHSDKADKLKKQNAEIIAATNDALNPDPKSWNELSDKDKLNLQRQGVNQESYAQQMSKQNQGSSVQTPQTKANTTFANTKRGGAEMG